MQIYLHIALGGIGSIQQRFVSSPFNWKTALKIKEFKRQLTEFSYYLKGWAAHADFCLSALIK